MATFREIFLLSLVILACSTGYASLTSARDSLAGEFTSIKQANAQTKLGEKQTSIRAEDILQVTTGSAVDSKMRWQIRLPESKVYRLAWTTDSDAELPKKKFKTIGWLYGGSEIGEYLVISSLVRNDDNLTLITYSDYSGREDDHLLSLASSSPLWCEAKVVTDSKSRHNSVFAVSSFSGPWPPSKQLKGVVHKQENVLLAEWASAGANVQLYLIERDDKQIEDKSKE